MEEMKPSDLLFVQDNSVWDPSHVVYISLFVCSLQRSPNKPKLVFLRGTLGN